MNLSTPGPPVLRQLPEFPILMSIESVMPFNHLILCHPLLLPPPIFPSTKVFSNESALCIRWPKYWNFSFNISSPSFTLSLFQPSTSSSFIAIRPKAKVVKTTHLPSVLKDHNLKKIKSLLILVRRPVSSSDEDQPITLF